MTTFGHHPLRMVDVGMALRGERGKFRLINGEGHRPKPQGHSSCQGQGDPHGARQQASPRGRGKPTPQHPDQGQGPQKGARERARDRREEGPKGAKEEKAGLGLMLRAPDPSEGGKHGKPDVGHPRRPISGGKHFALSHAPCTPCEGAGHGQSRTLEDPFGREVRTRHDMPREPQRQQGHLDGGELQSPVEVVGPKEGQPSPREEAQQPHERGARHAWGSALLENKQGTQGHPHGAQSHGGMGPRGSPNQECPAPFGGVFSATARHHFWSVGP